LVDLDAVPSNDDYVISYDADADKFYMKADATGAGGSGSMTTVKESDAPVGEADIVTLDFGAGFDLSEIPDTEVQISLDLSEYTFPSGVITDNTIQAEDVNWETTTDLDSGGAVKWGNIAEGELADSTVVSGDIKDGTITAADTAITAGRSLSWSTNDLSADAELYTETKCIYFEDPTADDDFKSIWIAKNAVTITSLWCESDQTVTAMLQVDDGSPADVDGTDLTCDSTPPEDTSLDGDATMAAGDRLDLDVASVSGTPTWVSICWTFTKDD